MNKDEKWMLVAINEAKKAEAIGEVPVGAIIVKNDQIIAKAHNKPILKNDPTAHAEILAIRSAGKKIKNYRLTGTAIYVTLEPCSMCLGAITWLLCQTLLQLKLSPWSINQVLIKN